MTSDELKYRTKLYSLSIINLVEKLPITLTSKVICNQIARSNKEFISKMEIVLEESDETLFWLEIIMDKNWLPKEIVEPIWIEGNQLTAIFVSSLRTVKQKSEI